MLQDSDDVAGYLMKTAQRCGYRWRVLIEDMKCYDIHEREFGPMAQCVANKATTVKIPGYLHDIFVWAIRYRREVTSWYRNRRNGPRRDAQHDAFAHYLQNALEILRSHRPRTERTRQTSGAAHTSTPTSLDN
ncbi:hypothetical protein EJ02DRAFT_163105 [Clathrospora elynae]|uniref:DUF6604 domain-containing protein n=1 Tax=Clathrospora elynae TaxID=706981 RepID=A0A6A5SSC1_9PLEO|nr:hypothetical protein EJ02DRAFT_163105 [Clathrospora elynae]